MNETNVRITISDRILAATVLKLLPRKVTPNQITVFRFFTVPFIAWRGSKERQFPTGTYYFAFDDVRDEEVVAAVQDCRTLTHA